jgi:hypothetical protein
VCCVAAAQYEGWLKALFQEYMQGDLIECTSHSVRRSAVKWAVRCMADSHAIMRGGRWVTMSGSFLLYIEDGELKRQENMATSQTSTDPIFFFWVWKPTVFELRR